MPRAGRWLEEAGSSPGDGSNDVQDLSTMGHVVVVGSPYHTIDLILASLATLIHVEDGSIGSRQWLYRSQRIFEMQFLIAPSSTWPVALTIVPLGP